MTKIKIAHVLHSVGGVDIYLRLITSTINPSEFENVIIHGTHDTSNKFLDKNSAPIKEFQIPIVREISFLKDIRSIIQTYNVIKKEKPHLIHAHSAKGGVIGRIIGMLTGIKVIYTPHAFSFLSSSGKIKRKAFQLVEKMLSKGNSSLLACSYSEKVRGIEEAGYNSQNAYEFNNPIEPIVRIEPLTIEKNWPDNYICTVGRPCYQKNIDHMIRVLYEVNKTKDTHLVIMGVGHHADQVDMVKKLIADLNLQSKVTLLNWTARTDVLNIISKAELYISTARYEGLPYAIIESMALGVPAVVSNCDGNRDIIKDGYNGYIIDSQDAAEFSKKIMSLSTDKEKYRQFSSNAKTTFNEKYDIREKINDLECLYLKLS